MFRSRFRAIVRWIGKPSSARWIAGSHELGEPPRAEPGEQLDDDVGRGWHELCDDVVLRHDLVTARGEGLDGCSFWSLADSDVAQRFARLGIPHEHGGDPREAGRVAEGDVENQQSRDCCVDGVAPLGEHFFHRLGCPGCACHSDEIPRLECTSWSTGGIFEGHRIAWPGLKEEDADDQDHEWGKRDDDSIHQCSVPS